MSTKINQGFTLVEVLIVVAIIGILAAIAYPSYQDQIVKSKRADGKAALVQTAQQFEKCKTLYGRYDSPGSTPYDCDAVRQTTGGTSIPSTENSYQVSASAVAASTFTLVATPQVSDPECGNLTFTQAGVRSSTIAGTNCW